MQTDPEIQPQSEVQSESQLKGITIRAWVCAVLVLTVSLVTLINALVSLYSGQQASVDETMKGALYVALGYYFGQRK